MNWEISLIYLGFIILSVIIFASDYIFKRIFSKKKSNDLIIIMTNRDGTPISKIKLTGVKYVKCNFIDTPNFIYTPPGESEDMYFDANL